MFNGDMTSCTLNKIYVCIAIYISFQSLHYGGARVTLGLKLGSLIKLEIERGFTEHLTDPEI